MITQEDIKTVMSSTQSVASKETSLKAMEVEVLINIRDEFKRFNDAAIKPILKHDKEKDKYVDSGKKAVEIIATNYEGA